jgi:hypothetical protein
MYLGRNFPAHCAQEMFAQERETCGRVRAQLGLADFGGAAEPGTPGERFMSLHFFLN